MKTAIIFLVIFALGITAISAQEKSKKQLKEEKKIEKQKQVEQMVNSKSFVFNAKTAMPTGYKTVNISTDSYRVKFLPEFIDSYLPYFGTAYSGVGYGGDTGLKFSGKPEEYTVTAGKKNYQVNAVVKGERDTFKIAVSVTFSGSASLTITSNNRSTITYSGDISEVKEP